MGACKAHNLEVVRSKLTFATMSFCCLGHCPGLPTGPPGYPIYGSAFLLDVAPGIGSAPELWLPVPVWPTRSLCLCRARACLRRGRRVRSWDPQSQVRVCLSKERTESVCLSSVSGCQAQAGPAQRPRPGARSVSESAFCCQCQ